MNTKGINNIKYFIAFALIVFQGCSKDWLDVERNLSTVVPKTLADYRAILNSSFSPSMADDYIGISLESADEYIAEEGNLYSTFIRNVYTWQETLYDDPLARVMEWDQSYQQVFSANVAIEGLGKLTKSVTNSEEWDSIFGSALFFRAKAFYNLLQQFAPSYQEDSAPSTAGIPLRLSPVADGAIVRADLYECYQQVLADLTAATELLPESVEHKTLPSKQAAYGLLARIQLSMGKFEGAAAYADSCLAIQSALMDYNEVWQNRGERIFAFDELNPEVVFHGTVTPLYNAALSIFSTVPSPKLSMYSQNDLRKVLFFDEENHFVGNYTGNERRFSGISTSEMLLIRAEARARIGMESEALADLRTLLSNRMKTGTFLALTSIQGEDLLDTILQERQRELMFRGLRWADLKRLNLDPRTQTTILRTVDGLEYSLPPNDSRYVFPIPHYIIQSSGMEQNNR